MSDHESTDFQPFAKIARLSREIVITEKIDGTNAQILIVPTSEIPIGTQTCAWNEQYAMFAGSRNRWLTLVSDNFGFCQWANENFEELLKLGPGRHFGEWWGGSIQRGYGLKQKRFSLFNCNRWGLNAVHGGVCERVKDAEGNPSLREGPRCCRVVPVLYRGPFCTNAVEGTMLNLSRVGSFAAPGFMDPEGIVVYHTASGHLFKKTCKDDEKPKGQP